MAEIAALIVAGASAAAGAVSSAAPIIGLLGTAATVAGTLYAGQAGQDQAAAQVDYQNQTAQLEATQLQSRAGEERAAANKEAQDQRRRTAYVISKQVAGAAASGGGVNNATILDIIGDTAQQGAFDALTTRAGGENRARGYLDQAKVTKWSAARQGELTIAKADSAYTGSILEAIGSGAEGLTRPYAPRRT